MRAVCMQRLSFNGIICWAHLNPFSSTAAENDPLWLVDLLTNLSLSHFKFPQQHRWSAGSPAETPHGGSDATRQPVRGYWCDGRADRRWWAVQSITAYTIWFRDNIIDNIRVHVWRVKKQIFFFFFFINRGQWDLRSASQDKEWCWGVTTGSTSVTKRPEKNSTPSILHQRAFLQP